MRFPLLALIAPLAVLLLSASRLPAQGRDIRLAPELRDYSLPEEAQIQSVASIGSRHLVVWGTTAFTPDSSVVNVLWMQLLDSSKLLGPSALVHDSTARPYGFVKVIATNGQFLVFWNDRRSDAPGTYYRRFDFNCNPISTETRIDIGPVANDTLHRPKSQTSILSYAAFPGWTFVQIDSARPFIVHADGSVDLRPLAIAHMQGAYYLAEDTSATVLRGKEVWFYRNLFDSVPVRKVAVPGLDSALAGSEVVTRDSLGRYRLIYGVISDRKTYASTYWSAEIADSGITIHILFTDAVPTYPESPYYSFPYVVYKNYGADRQRGCDNKYRITIHYLAWTYHTYHGTNIPDQLDNYPFVTDVASDGSTVRTGGYRASQFYACQTVSPNLARRPDTLSSWVDIRFEHDTVQFQTSVGFTRPKVPRSRPNLFRDSLTLIVSWSFNGENRRAQSGAWTFDDPARPVSFIAPLGFGRAYRNPQALVEGKNYSQIERIIHLNGASYAYSDQRRNDTGFEGSYRLVPVEVSYFEVRVLSRTGWGYLYTGAGYGYSGELGPGNGYPASSFYINGIGFDNYTTALVATITETPRRYDTNIAASTANYSYQNKFEDGFGQKYLWDYTKQRMQENRWIYWHIAGDSTHWTLEVVDTAGTIYATRTLQFAGTPRNIFVTQNYPDKSIAIIWGGIGGVRATFLNQQLEPLAENMQVSTTTDSVSFPTGAYRNDSLFVAWEDYRNGGIPDVYGTAFTAPKASEVAVTGTGRQPMGEMTIAPNPAREIARITLPEASSGVRIAVYDALGRLRLQREISGERIVAQELDVSALPAGAYMVRVTAGDRAFGARFVIAR
jgi:hypothetical protein